jgi:hypothetical protein
VSPREYKERKIGQTEKRPIHLDTDGEWLSIAEAKDS